MELRGSSTLPPCGISWLSYLVILQPKLDSKYIEDLVENIPHLKKMGEEYPMLLGRASSLHSLEIDDTLCMDFDLILM